MSSGCGKLDSRDVDVILEKPTLKGKKCSDGLKLLLYSGIEDAQKEKHVYEKCEEKEPSSVRSPGADGSPCKSSDGQDYHEDDDFAIALQLMFYEPTPVRLVSAMKGSREKQGNSAGKLKVKWAEDVYDPPPSISSHTRCKMQPQAQTRSKSKDGCKRNGKKGQKGKDKKHSSRNKQSREELRVGNPESHCAGSFLRSNPTKVHLSVAT